MKYYKIALLGSPLEPFSYSFDETIPLYTQVRVKLQNRSVYGVVVENIQKPEFEVLKVEEITPYYYIEKQIKIARFIAGYYVCSLGDALGVFTPFEDKPQNKTSKHLKIKTAIELTKKQQKALLFLQEHPVSLLFGDTGSGKTEIYMKFFEQILQANKRAVFLMPEISLTPQMAQRLQEHFGEWMVMWHSKLTKKQKEQALLKIRSGKARIVAGPRSALFLPVNDLGLIVVDEEHDDSYKSNQRPRYHARDIAVYMGKLYGIPVILGSATPSLGSYEKYPHIRLKGRHFETQRKFIYEPSVESLTPLILQKIKQTLQKKEQTILFLPTRANFKYLQCASCGEGFECPYCSVGMSLHLRIRALKCHYCGYTQAIPKVCHKCGSEELVSSRLGTAEAVEELKKIFSEASIEQFDRDTITTQAKLKKTLKRFNDKEIDILVGTQMLSKGHDYHSVTLAVVLGVDNMLGMGDYRAREKALSTLVQIAGRSGRKSDAEVIVQTFNEEFVQSFLEDYDAFLEEEKFFREDLYPPYRRLARVLFAHKNAARAREAMEQMRAGLQRFSKEVEIVGSGECNINKVTNKYRYEILLRSQKATDLIRAVKAAKVPLAEVDIDPVEFH